MMKSRLFYGAVSVLALVAFGLSEAQAVEVIRDEDMAFLESSEGKASAQAARAAEARLVRARAAAEAAADEDDAVLFGGTEVKGALDTSRVKAVPYFGKKSKNADTQASGLKGALEAVSGTDAKAVDGAQQKTLVVKQTVAKTPDLAIDKAVRNTYTKQEEKAAVYKAGGEEPGKIRYITEDGEIYYVDVLDDAVVSKEEEAAVVSAEGFRDKIAACLDDRAADISLEREMLYKTNTYNAAAYLTRSFAEVNACYENLGNEIIEAYYGGDKKMADAFFKKAQTFYASAADVDMDNMAACDEKCSLEALYEAQMKKFAAFRVYLTKLLSKSGEEAL